MDRVWVDARLGFGGSSRRVACQFALASFHALSCRFITLILVTFAEKGRMVGIIVGKALSFVAHDRQDMYKYLFPGMIRFCRVDSVSIVQLN